MSFERATVYYVDEKPPTFTMKKLTGGVIAVIVVVALAVIIGLLVLVSTPKFMFVIVLSSYFHMKLQKVFCSIMPL